MIPRTWNLFARLFPDILFRVHSEGVKNVYLTFDDGPHPEATGFVLDCLSEYNAKATFFTVGENVQRYPDVMQRIHREGHASGHHTQHHLDALHGNATRYLADVEEGAKQNPSPYFRPPYGRLTFRTYRALKNRYKIVLWDVLSEDYDQRYTARQCIEKVMRQVRPGSVVVLHDNPKCLEKLRLILPAVLSGLREKGYRLEKLPG